MKKAILALPVAALSLVGFMAHASEDVVLSNDEAVMDESTYFDARSIEYRDFAYVVRCESNDYRYVECRAPGRGFVAGAQLIRPLSRLACVEGRNWGVTNDGVWVSGGCRGEFRVLVNERRDDRRDDRRGGRGDDRRGDGRGDDRRGDGRGDDRRGDGRGDDRRGDGRGDDRRDDGRGDGRGDDHRDRRGGRR